MEDTLEDPPTSAVLLDHCHFSQVIFNNVEKFYVPGGDVTCYYTLTDHFIPRRKDWIGIFRVGWKTTREYYTFMWVALPTDVKSELTKQQEVQFKAYYLPKDDEYYQFCYVDQDGVVRGASIPFQFCPENEEDILVVTTQEELETLKSINKKLEQKVKEQDSREAELLQLKEQNQKISSENKNMKVRVDQLQAQLSTQEKEMEKLVQGNQDKTEQLEHLKKEHGQLFLSLTEQRERQKTLEQTVEELKHKEATATKKQQELTDQNFDLSKRLSENKIICDVLQKEKQNLEGENDILKRENSRMMSYMGLDFDSLPYQVPTSEQGGAGQSPGLVYGNPYSESYEDDCADYPTLAEYVQDFLNHLTEQPGSFETEIEQFSETLTEWVTTDDAFQELVELIYQQATSIPNFSYMGACLCNYLSHHLTISSQSGSFRQLLLQRCRTEYEVKDQAAKGNEETRKRFHAFALFLGELYLNLETRGTNGQVTRADIFQVALPELLNALLSNPVDDNLICAIKLLKLTGSVLEDVWKERGKTDMEEIFQRIENVVLDANCSRDIKQMLLKLLELRLSNWGRVHVTSTYRKATPENDPNYFMNEPTFYTYDGVPFTASDSDYQEKYQELLEREDFFPDYEENGTDLSGAGDPYLDDIDDEMDPEIEEAYEKFCLESEHKQKQ
ncbi:calcium-binding and coiled-coil domain-containing protein 2 isoform 2-T4 [Hipposideros larvatus]